MLKGVFVVAVLTTSMILGGLLAQTTDTGAQSPPLAAPTPFNPGIGDLMNLIVQPRHTKLWFAGREGNWVLAEYEAKELRSALANVARARPSFRNQAVGETIQAFTSAPFMAIDAAIKDHDATKFAEAYASLNGGCNACHAALSQPQVVIKVPEQPTDPDQDFRPRN